MNRKNFKVYLLAAIVGSFITYDLKNNGYFLGAIPTMIFWGVILSVANWISNKLYPNKSDNQSSSDLPITNKPEESISQMFLENMKQKSNVAAETPSLENNLPNASKISKPDKYNKIILVLSFIAIIAIASCLIFYAYDKGYSEGYSNGNVAWYNDAVDTWYDIGFSDAQGKYKVKHDSDDSALVWVADRDSKYHAKKSCSNSGSPYLVTVEEAEDMGRKPCKKCY